MDPGAYRSWPVSYPYGAPPVNSHPTVDSALRTAPRAGQPLVHLRPAPPPRGVASSDGDHLRLAHQHHQTLAARGLPPISGPALKLEFGASEQSYYRWRKEYGGLRTDQAKRLKDLEKENGRLRKAISDLTLDKLILKEALEGNC